MYRENEDQPFRDVIKTDFRESIQPLFFDFDNGSTVYASSNLNRDKSVIIKFDMDKGEEVGDIIFSHPDVDVSNLNYSEKRKVLTSISYNTTISIPLPRQRTGGYRQKIEIRTRRLRTLDH